MTNGLPTIAVTGSQAHWVDWSLATSQLRVSHSGS